MNYLILAASAVGKILEEDPVLNKSARKGFLKQMGVGKGKGSSISTKKEELKRKNWLSKYIF